MTKPKNQNLAAAKAIEAAKKAIASVNAAGPMPLVPQQEMRERARQHIADRDRVFMELMTSTHPLTPEEIDMLATKFPERWSRYRKFAQAQRRETSASASKVKAGHMQPQVFKTNVAVAETEDGTFYIPAKDARISSSDSDEERQAKIANYIGTRPEYIEDSSFEQNKWLARSSAPGYMDQTDYSMFDTEEEAWEYLIDMDASLFTWTVELTASEEEGGTAHIYMASDAAAKAMQKAVQSLGGAKLERDGDFVYAPLSGNGEDVMSDLDGMGFSTEEG